MSLKKFAELGTSVNAFTSYNNTTYLFRPLRILGGSLKLLMEFVEAPYFTKESVEKEKGIITQNLMYEDEPDWQILINLLRCLYHNHPIRIDIGGTVESIAKIDVDTLYKCYNTFYHPSNMILFVAGCIDPEQVFNLVKQQQDKK